MNIIIENTDKTITRTCVAGGIDIKAHALQIAEGKPFHLVAMTDMPKETQLSEAWRVNSKGKVTTDMVVAKQVAHVSRRAKRAELLQPLDMMATWDLATAEPKRKTVRAADAKTQAAIDAAVTPAEIVLCLV